MAKQAMSPSDLAILLALIPFTDRATLAARLMSGSVYVPFKCMPVSDATARVYRCKLAAILLG